jgi:hypothetical protein
MNPPPIPWALRWCIRRDLLTARYDKQSARWIYFVPRGKRVLHWYLILLRWIGLA